MALPEPAAAGQTAASTRTAPAPPEPRREPGPGRLFGIQPYVDQAVARIRRHFESADARDALVIGVFGEWGSGKSTMIEAIGTEFRNELPQLIGDAEGVARYSEQTLRIDFNAWRYEREEHLLIPLLKTVEKVLDDFIGRLRAREQAEAGPTGWTARFRRRPTRADSWRWLGERATLLGACVIALTRAFKLKVGVPVLGEVEFTPYEALKGAQEQIDRATKAKPGDGRALDSLYYDLYAQLRRLTRGDHPGAPKLNFVFLVDDLDRCLPDKAVEMLEAIKLFLDVEGCVFVLALDDEVIERGIVHRYRDYLEATDRAAESIAYSLDPDRYGQYVSRVAGRRLPPITGHEYLEKIVQLPFRLPRWSETEARDFLAARYPELLEKAGPDVAEEAAARALREQRRWLLDLFVRAVPPIPRKLLRAAELLEFVRAVARARGLDDRLQPYTLAQLTLLQLFAPQCFRFLRRRRLQGWLTLEKRLRGEPADYQRSARAGEAAADAGVVERRPDWRSPTFFDWWEGLCEVDAKSKPNDAWYIENVERPLVSELRQACANRGGFDPRNLFLLERTELRVDETLEPYFSLFAEPQVEAVVARAGAVRPGRPQEPEQFVAQLLSTSREAWLNALERERNALQGRVLDSETFERLLRGAAVPEAWHLGAAWLEVVAPLLAAAQVKRLVAQTGLLARLATLAGLHAAAEPVPQPAEAFAAAPAAPPSAAPAAHTTGADADELNYLRAARRDKTGMLK